MSALSKSRRWSYAYGRRAGDLAAALHPRRLPKRIANKIVGRKVVSRLWFR